jgi:hypothetical protein
VTLGWRAIQDNVDESESLAALSDFAERLYWRLVAKADSWGRLPGSTGKVRARCVPLLPKTDEEIQAALTELHEVGRVFWHEVDGRWFLEIADFCRNQPRDATRTRKDSAFPEYQGKREVAASRGETAPRGRWERETEISSIGERSGDPAANGLPVDRELETQKLLAAIGKDADENTPAVIRALVKRLPESSVAKVRESLEIQKPRNCAQYAVKALQSEFAELAGQR